MSSAKKYQYKTNWEIKKTHLKTDYVLKGARHLDTGQSCIILALSQKRIYVKEFFTLITSERLKLEPLRSYLMYIIFSVSICKKSLRETQNGTHKKSL